MAQACELSELRRFAENVVQGSQEGQREAEPLSRGAPGRRRNIVSRVQRWSRFQRCSLGLLSEIVWLKPSFTQVLKRTVRSFFHAARSFRSL